MNKAMLVFLAALPALTALATASDAQQRGKDLFARRCSGCHSPDANREGPRLGGVYGRMPASVPDFVYSDSLKKLKVRWDEATLDRWLANPEAMAPDTDMGFHVPDAGERNALIAYLKTLPLRH